MLQTTVQTAYKHLEHSPKIPKWRFETRDSPTHESTQSATIYYRYGKANGNAEGGFLSRL
jgi:hypothetical protein